MTPTERRAIALYLYGSIYRMAFANRVRATRRRWDRRHPVTRKMYLAEWSRENREQAQQNHAAWRKANAVHFRRKARGWVNTRNARLRRLNLCVRCQAYSATWYCPECMAKVRAAKKKTPSAE